MLRVSMLRSWLAGLLLVSCAAFASAQSTHTQAPTTPATPPGVPSPDPNTEPSSEAPAPPAFAPDASNAPAPKPAGPVRISGGVMAAMITSKVDPVPPAGVSSSGASVVLDTLISKMGTVETVKLVSGPPNLGAAAMDAVKRWTYKPFLLNGRPVEVRTTVTVNFGSKTAGAP